MPWWVDGTVTLAEHHYFLESNSEHWRYKPRSGDASRMGSTLGAQRMGSIHGAQSMFMRRMRGLDNGSGRYREGDPEVPPGHTGNSWAAAAPPSPPDLPLIVLWYV